MTEDKSSPSKPQGFFIKDPARLQAKLERFVAADPEHLHFVCDFDHTLTRRVASSDSVGTWGIIDKLLPREGRARHRALYALYRPLEKGGSLTGDQARHWYGKTLDLICGYQINFCEAEKTFLQAVSLRPGARELSETCRRAGVPTIILSAGIKQVIDLFVREHGIDPTVVLSTELELDPDGHISGWRPQTLIHALNKKEMGHHELVRIRKDHPYIILLGDTPEDVHMAEGADDVLRICVMDPRNGETFSQEHFLEASFQAGYDLVVKDSLEPAANLIEELVKR